MSNDRARLPRLTVNRRFMSDFLAEQPPCLALGLVEVGGSQSALIALRLNTAIPSGISAAGFAFGHALLGGKDWEVVHFGFEFYGYETYNVLINPNNAVTRSVLNTMVQTGDYFFFAPNSDRGTTAFRSDIRTDNLAGLKTNLSRIQGSMTTDAQYRQAVSQFAMRPEPPGTLLTWVCRNDPEYLDLTQDRLVLSPA